MIYFYKKHPTCIIIALWLLITPSIVNSQVAPEISYSKNTIALNEEFFISFLIKKQKLKTFPNFPDIPDFVKTKTSVNQSKSETVVIQSYRPLKKGIFDLENNVIFLNNKSFDLKNTQIKVIEKNAKIPLIIENTSPPNYKTVFDHCELKLEVDKVECFKTESILLKLLLLVHKDNQANLNFFNLKNQLVSITNQVKPNNCWIQDLTDLNEIKLDTNIASSNIKSKYILYQCYINPTKAKNFNIPQLKFQLIKYDFYKSSTEIWWKDTIVTLYSSPIEIKVKNTPKEIENIWTAGEYQLNEELSKKEHYINQAIELKLSISHHGITGLLPSFKTIENKKFNIFVPSEMENMVFKHNNYIGKKTFNYTIIPRVTGEIELSKYFYWIFYNTKTYQVDTLRPSSVIHIASLPNHYSKNEQKYNIKEWEGLLKKSSHKIQNLEQNPLLKWVSNILILLMLIITLYIIFKK